MLKRIISILFPLTLSAAVLSPDAIALTKGYSFHETEQQVRARASSGKISGTMIINNTFDDNQFISRGGSIFTRTDTFLTVEIPFELLNELDSISGIVQFQPARKVFPAMDNARTSGKAIHVYSGENLSKIYSGTGVIVGIIDGGFEYEHPAFFDTNNKLRISRVWDQNGSGLTPKLFPYGAISSSSSAILAQKGDLSKNTLHATHVAGIAGGSRNSMYFGVAPESELVFVSTNWYDNGIADGIKWIFDYADSVNKPAVINLSLGSHYGPHDGTSAIDRIIESLTGKGRIVVGSAGNERSDQAHIKADFAGTNTFRSAMTIPKYGDKTTGLQQLSLWGDEKLDFSVQVELYSGSTRVAQSNLFSISKLESEGYKEFTVSNNGISVEGAIFGQAASPLNGKPEMVLQLTSTTPLTPNLSLIPVLVIVAPRGTVHGWSAMGNTDGHPGFHSNNGTFTPGDSAYTVGEIGGTGRATISVGAFTSKTSFINTFFNESYAHGVTEGEMAPFSSVGPTVDGRIKPDITAPGDVIISAFRSNVTDDHFAKLIKDTVPFNNHTFPYGGISGTSMAAPFVTGSVALMLEANPELTPMEIKKILKQSARTDSIAEVIPVSGSVSWGAGKINVDSAVSLAEKSKDAPRQPRAVQVVRVTQRENESLELNISGAIGSTKVELFDLRGRLILSKSFESASIATPISLRGVAAGTYIYEIRNASVSQTGKIAIRQ